MNSLIRLLGCVTFIYHWNDKTYKLFTPLGNKSRIAEYNANKSALSADFWAHRVIKVRPHILSLSMDRGYPVSWEKPQLAEKFITSKLSEALLYPRQQCNEAYDFTQLLKLADYGFDRSLISQAENNLSALSLPLTSSHGDLHIGNIILVNNNIQIIDWTMYNHKGSFITDYIHFYNYMQTLKYGESWTVTILREQDYLNQLSLELNTTPSLLKLAYSISRIIGEINQYNSLSLIPISQITKYNNVLSNLISATSKSPCSVS
jgi:hypothetical protein